MDAAEIRALLETLGALAALLIAFAGLAGLAARLVVLPWLEDRFQPLADKLHETHHQVTVNGHVSAEPTLKDRVDTNVSTIQELARELRELKGETRHDLAAMKGDMDTVGALYESHIRWSNSHAREVWSEIIALGLAIRQTEDGNPAEDREDRP